MIQLTLTTEGEDMCPPPVVIRIDPAMLDAARSTAHGLTLSLAEYLTLMIRTAIADRLVVAINDQFHDGE